MIRHRSRAMTSAMSGIADARPRHASNTVQ
jgi:hypothetical protein